jgi:uncharacterized protein
MNQWQRFEQPTNWISSSSETTFEREQAFLRYAWTWMFGGLMLTAATAFAVTLSPALQQLVFNPVMSIVLLVSTLGIVVFLSFRVTKLAPTTAGGLFIAYAVLNGLMLSGILFVYTGGTIVSAFVTAAGMFGAMAIYGTVTKRDLTSWGSFFFMGLVGIILAQVINMFVRSSALDGTIALIGVFVFVGLTAWDAQKLKAYAAAAGPQVTNYAVIGALALYLDFINLFLMLLRLFGRRD